eukprot:TRINITY_DN106586_c0_g1_i1.p1 TRINITY_DN106586_c0_g1~~TRINITY_DN106586_c0_g1_i1.p1  ORF type:complete len:343 (+),score=26.59 TRINITY_DN106586_c0_g1_i1:141-1169(+)
MSKVAPEINVGVVPPQQQMQSYGPFERKPALSTFHVMRDGWEIHGETFILPGGDPKAVLLHCHGSAESTMSIGVRRFAHQCKERNIIMETFEQSGHGLSLKRHGQQVVPQRMQSMYYEKGRSAEVWCDHLVEIAEIVIKKHKPLPLILTGHSFGGSAALAATAKIADLCKEHSVKFLTAVYMAPGLYEGSAPPCFNACLMACICCCCWSCCCCNGCGGGACIPCSIAQNSLNPNQVFTGPDYPDRNPHYCNCSYSGWPCGPAYSRVINVEAAAKNVKSIDRGFLYVGDKDELRKCNQQLSVAAPHLTFVLDEGVAHEFLHEEGGMESIAKIWAHIDEALNAA